VRRPLVIAAILVIAAVIGCDALTDVAVSASDFAAATADAHCDRRFVTDGGQAAAFCQEVSKTVAASQFADDCRGKHLATAGPGLCDRPRIIAGCKLRKVNQDNSLVWDWYYDVSDILADAGTHAGPDGGFTFDDVPPKTVADVAKLCASRSRYEDGADLALP
jgi:hypothetical protein